MCGIAGGVNISPEWVTEALKHQHMRGPDNTGIQTIGNVTFGHNRLSIIDLSERSNQPFENGRCMLTYNGEIYNYNELLRERDSDSTMLFELLHDFGINSALASINGMFAFAYYDNFKGNSIHLAVDRFGQKPLYYFHEGNTFAFASTPAALYGLKDKWELDRDALQSYWLLGSVMGENGLMNGVKKLCASEHLTYNVLTNSVKVERYWEPKYINTIKRLEDQVLESVRKTLVSDVPVFLFLSGGIDSTIIASQMEGMKAIHLDGPERRYAEEVARKFNIDLKIIDPTDTDTEEALTDYVFKSGEPAMSAIIPWIVARETAKYGKVAISANGSDELFFGYDRTSDDVTRGQFDHIFRHSVIDATIGQPFYNEGISRGRMFELNTYVQFDLNKTLDFASMCHGLEVRNPFLDHELVEMALSIPEKIHRQNGNKTILKNMLRKMGFSEAFLNRPKQGFSLFKQPKNLDKCVNLAWDWVQKEGFLDLKGKVLNGRDERYLKMSALGFYYWYKTWKHKIKTDY